MKWVILTAIVSTKANSFLSRMHKSMGKSIINIEKERLYREGSSQEKKFMKFISALPAPVLGNADLQYNCLSKMRITPPAGWVSDCYS